MSCIFNCESETRIRKEYKAHLVSTRVHIGVFNNICENNCEVKLNL